MDARRGRRFGRVPAAALGLMAACCAQASWSQAEPPPTSIAEDDYSTIVDDLFAAGKFAEAETRARRRLADVERDHGPESLEAAEIIDDLVAALWQHGRTSQPETRALAERGLAIRRRVLGPEHADVATSLNNVAGVLLDTGDLLSARKLYEDALAIREKALGPDHPAVAKSYSNLAYVLGSAGDLAAAQPLCERALAIQRRALGPEHPDVATTLNDLANLVRQAGDLASARPLYEEALTIRRKALDPNDPDVATTLNDLANLVRETGDLASARPLYEESLAIWRNVLGPDHPDVATTLGNLASLVHATGDFASARPLQEQALTIAKKALGPDHPNVAAGLGNLAIMAQETGDHAAARPLFEEALAIWRKALGPDHPIVAGGLNNLANLLRDAGDRTAARPLFEEALAIRRKALGPDHPAVAESLNNLANLLHDTGDPAAARALYEEALAIRRKTLGPDHSAVAGSLHNLAGLFRDSGDVASARPLVEEALAIWKKARGADHPLVATSLDNLAGLLRARGDASGSLARALEAERIGRAHLEVTSQALSEREALRYARARPSGLATALSVVAHAPADAAAARATWDAGVRSRALVLDAMAERRRAVPTDPASHALAENLASASQRLANLWTRGPGNGPPEQWRKLVDDARLEKERAERDLAAASAEFRGEQERRHAGLDEVTAALPRDAALVGYFRHARWPVGTPERPALGKPVDSYVAFVLPVGPREPVAVPLGEAGEIDALVARWRSAVANPPADDGDAVRQTGTTLRERAWDPLLPHLGDAGRVVVVPDGALNLVNCAALPSADGRWLVETGPLIHHLSAERDLVAAPAQGGRGLLALGGPDFDAGAPSAPIAVVASAASRRSGCTDLESLAWTPLPGADREAAEVARAWTKRRKAEPAVHLAGALATEAAFKNGAAGARVLHLATHGFFAGASCESATETSRGVAAGPRDVEDRRALTGENPLLLSGLALAGANNRRSAAPEKQDGILTAEEIASLDLSSCEWAVLSACGTGLGDVQAGEGVMGLQRAFAMAGARTVVMSLWSVDDEATRHWMKELYRSRLQRRLDTAECVREASLAVLRERRARGDDDSPFWWGAFVASGDWR